MAPMNGWAYTPIELNAIWEMPLDTTQIIEGRTATYEFHYHASTLPINPQKKKDRWAVEIIIRATIAEVENRPTPEPPEWPCTIHYDDGSDKPTPRL